MELGQLNNITDLLDEVKRLQDRSELLGEILNYYDPIKDVFDVPEKWKNSNSRLIKKERQPHLETPRTLLRYKMGKLLTEEEKDDLFIY